MLSHSSLKLKRVRARSLVLAAVCLLMLVALSGCQAISFYKQAIAGQYEILARQTPVRQLIADPATAPGLKAQLEQVLKLREFAARELKLPADENYLKYADLHRPYVVWNVNVAPPLSLEPKTWWFPVAGSASYRGYFSEEAARRYARGWEQKGWDVYVGGVEAYSTLGWFHDPLLNTFIFDSEADLADLIFHELGHQRLFVAGDTDFNEAFAMTVAAAGVRRWFESSQNTKAYEEYRRSAGHENDFVELVMAARQELQAVYADPRAPDAVKLQRKAEIIRELRANYAKLKGRWGVSQSGYDAWFAEPINNAKLNTISAYHDLAPAFEALLRAQGGDMEKFYGAARDLSKMPLARRHEALRANLKTR
ncbi:MAG: aminopeptidase [Verrucomicrobiota bacterium]